MPALARRQANAVYSIGPMLAKHSGSASFAQRRDIGPMPAFHYMPSRRRYAPGIHKIILVIYRQNSIGPVPPHNITVPAPCRANAVR